MSRTDSDISTQSGVSFGDSTVGWGPGQAPDVYPPGAGATQLFGQYLGGAAGGHDIIDQRDMINLGDLFESLWIDAERVAQIEAALFGGQSLLMRGVKAPQAGDIIDRNLQLPAEAVGQLSRLVEAALIEPVAVQGYWDQLLREHDRRDAYVMMRGVMMKAVVLADAMLSGVLMTGASGVLMTGITVAETLNEQPAQ